MNQKHFYAMQSPRGFANENNIYRFTSRAERDAWVEKHADDGDVNSALCGAKTCTRAEALEILHRRDDACTIQRNALIEVCGEEYLPAIWK